ncbi:MAG: hypothetical protein LBN36_03765 [Clostridiales Family XIII bacterium]|jgi:hypothetical protein|nr:hypothetical protein [Clostridiales Family XIII bacterium]
MKKPTATVITYVLVLALFCSASIYAFADKNTVSDEENRSLQRRPTFSASDWFSGSFAGQMNSFFLDHVFNRDQFIAFAQFAERVFQRKMAANVVSGNADGGNGGNPENTALPSLETEYMLLDDRILPIFRYDSSLCDTFADVASIFFGNLPEGTNQYMMIAPGRIAFEAPEYAENSDDQKTAIEHVYDRMNAQVMTVDAYAALEAHAAELEKLYFRLDHHWTHLGAYYGAQALWKTLGMDYRPIEQYVPEQGPSYLGYLYAVTGSQDYANQSDELIYYLYNGDVGSEMSYEPGEDAGQPLNQVSGAIIDPSRGGYYTYVDSVFAYAVLKGEKRDGSCLLVVGDSYINALASWLTVNYETVIVIDPRYYDRGRSGILELCSQYHVTDALIMNYTVSLDSAYYIGCLSELTR